MSSKRVPIARGGEPSIPVEVGATVGATVGVNLRWEDGTLVTREDLAPEPPAEGLSVTYWRMIREIPANVVALAETTTTGLYVITGDGASATRAIQPAVGETTVSNGDGVAGDPVVGLADVADSGSGALLAITRDAKGRVSGTKNATITGTAGQIEVADGDAVAGLPTISLADVTPTPGGTLQRYGFDAKGRRIEEGAADTDDLAEGSANLYFTNDRADARITAQKGQPNGLATLDADAKLEANQLPALAITDTFVVNTEAAMLALDAQQGDVAVRTDEQRSYILTADPASTLGNWQELLTPTGTGGTVTSVALSVPTGLKVSGSPITSSGTITVAYDTGYQGYTSAEALKLSGIQAGAQVNAVNSVNGKTGSVSLSASDVGAAPRGAMCFLSSDIPLATDDTLAVPFSAVSFDDDGWWSPSAPTRVTVPAGVSRVRITFSAGFSARSGGHRSASLSKNGNSNFRGNSAQRAPPSGGIDYLNGSTGIIEVSPGDYFELLLSQNSGGSVNVRGTSAGFYTWIAIESVPSP